MTGVRWAALGSLALFVVSLALPAIEGSGFPTQSGLDVLRRGSSGWRDGVLAWYANPLLIAALITVALGWFRLSLGFAVIAAGLGLSSFAAAATAASAGRTVPPFGYAIGFYVWLAAIFLAVLAAAFGIYKVSKSARAR